MYLMQQERRRRTAGRAVFLGLPATAAREAIRLEASDLGVSGCRTFPMSCSG